MRFDQALFFHVTFSPLKAGEVYPGDPPRMLAELWISKDRAGLVSWTSIFEVRLLLFEVPTTWLWLLLISSRMLQELLQWDMK